MEKELISVVITTYKRSDKVENAIKSVINQTYENIEIIVVDDNFNFQKERDKTEKIVKKYKNINYIKNKTQLGGALSRNVGIKASNGNLISFLDDDDEYLPTRIEKMYKCYCKNKDRNIGLIYCNCYSVDNDRNIHGSYENTVEGKPLYEQMINCIAATSLWLVPKKVLEDINMFEDVPCKQDSIVLLKIITSGYNIFCVNENLVYYTEHSGDRISGTKQKNIDGLINYRVWCRKYYHLLSSEKEIKDIEYNFSKQLLTFYCLNNNKKYAFKEFKNMIKIKPFNKKTIIGMAKILFSKSYMKYIRRKNDSR